MKSVEECIKLTRQEKIEENGKHKIIIIADVFDDKSNNMISYHFYADNKKEFAEMMDELYNNHHELVEGFVKVVVIGKSIPKYITEIWSPVYSYDGPCIQLVRKC